MSWFEQMQKHYPKTPLEHYSKDHWSIQTEQTHGKKGIVKVSRKPRIEDPKMSLHPRKDYERHAGAEDIFLGSKEALINYIHERYKTTKKILFV